MNIFLILNCYCVRERGRERGGREREREREMLESLNLNPLDSCLWGWMKNNIYKTKVVTRAELPFRISDAAASIKKCEDQLRRTTRHFRTRFAKCTEVGRGIFENLS